MTKEQVVQVYLMNSPKVVAEMLYETIERYESRSCESCTYCRQFAELGLCDKLRGYTNMHLIKYCGNWESKNE